MYKTDKKAIIKNKPSEEAIKKEVVFNKVDRLSVPSGRIFVALMINSPEKTVAMTNDKKFGIKR